MVVVDGPVTRDGDGCSYGTKDFRDQVMYANQIPQVIGHLFLINTPGGQASCRNDYEMMIDDCRQAGKPTVAFIDGMCCSSGVNLACRCDRVVVMNPRDEFGCIGTMAAFWAVAHDTVDQDGYRYVELVGKDCPEKNDWYREAAAGEYEKLQAELDRDTEQFHQTVRENRPLVTADMLTGKVFEAQEVMPALVDEIGDMNRAIECIYELANETLTAARLVTAEPKNEPDGEQPEGEEPEEMSKLNAQQKAAIAMNKGGDTVVDDGHVRLVKTGMFGGTYEEEVANPKNQEDMTDEKNKAAEVAEQPAATQEQAPATEQPAEGAAATEAPAVSEENAQEEQPAAQEGAPAAEPATEQPASQDAQEAAAAEIDKIQETLESAQALVAQRDQEIAQLKETLATLNGIAEERDQANATVAERDKTIETLTAEKDEQGKTIAEHVATITAKDAKIAEHVATIEKLQKQVKELQSEVKELSEKPAPMVDAGAGIPQDNGTGEAPQYNGIKSAVKPGMTPKEIAAALRKQDEEIAARNHRR